MIFLTRLLRLVDGVRLAVVDACGFEAFEVGDDVDASLVVDSQGMLYVSVELERFNARSEEVGQLIKLNPFHPFSSFYTSSLCGVAFGQTVLSRAVEAAGLEFDESSAHSAAYDAEITADVFCEIVNRFQPVFQKRVQSRLSKQRL